MGSESVVRVLFLTPFYLFVWTGHFDALLYVHRLYSPTPAVAGVVENWCKKVDSQKTPRQPTDPPANMDTRRNF